MEVTRKVDTEYQVDGQCIVMYGKDEYYLATVLKINPKTYRIQYDDGTEDTLKKDEGWLVGIPNHKRSRRKYLTEEQARKIRVEAKRSEMYGIAEWFGRPFARLTAARRRSLARSALGHTAPPLCPFQRGTPPCSKEGGVCSL